MDAISGEFILRDFHISLSFFERKIREFTDAMESKSGAGVLRAAEVAFLGNFLDGLSSACVLSNIGTPETADSLLLARRSLQLACPATELKIAGIRPAQSVTPSSSNSSSIILRRRFVRLRGAVLLGHKDRRKIAQQHADPRTAPVGASSSVNKQVRTDRLEARFDAFCGQLYAADRRSGDPLSNHSLNECFVTLVNAASFMRDTARQELRRRIGRQCDDFGTTLHAYAKHRGLDIARLPSFEFKDFVDFSTTIAALTLGGDLEWPIDGACAPRFCSVVAKGRFCGNIFFSFPTMKSGEPSFAVPLINRATRGQEEQPAAILLQCPLTKMPSGKAKLSYQRFHSFMHEMGHAVHHLSTEINDPRFSGIDSIETSFQEVVSNLFEKQLYTAQFRSTFANSNRSENDISSLQALKRLEFCENFLSEVCLSHVDFVCASQIGNRYASPASALAALKAKWDILDPPDLTDLLPRISDGFAFSYLGKSYRYPLGHTISSHWSQVLQGEPRSTEVKRFTCDAMNMWRQNDRLLEPSSIKKSTQYLVDFYTDFA